MTVKEMAIKEIKKLPDQFLIEVYDFITFLKHKKDSLYDWGVFALSSGSFDFWNEPDEVEYDLRDLKQKR